jgi:hypothetical protein
MEQFCKNVVLKQVGVGNVHLCLICISFEVSIRVLVVTDCMHKKPHHDWRNFRVLSTDFYFIV